MGEWLVKTTVGMFFILTGVFFAVSVSAAESKEEKLSADATQQRYQRKSMTYLGLGPGVTVPQDHLEIIVRAVRGSIELSRFDINQVELRGQSVERFVSDLREYVARRAYDRAAAEAEYEARFKANRVLMSDIDRIMSSAYFYFMKVTTFRSWGWTCPADKEAAKKQGCSAGATYESVALNAEVTFYRANLLDASGPPCSLLKTITLDAPVESATVVAMPPQPRTPEEAADYHQRVAEAKKMAALSSTSSAVGGLFGLAPRLSKQMKQIPDFQLKTPVTAALPDGVEFMLGKHEGLMLDDTYDVSEFDAAGEKAIIGYVKVRDIGEARGTGEGTPSYAEKVKERKDFVGGEQLFEHPMLGVSVGVDGLLQFSLSRLRGDNSKYSSQVVPGFSVLVDANVGRYLGLSELYACAALDMGYMVPEEGDGHWLSHITLGFLKKWYAESLVFTLGIRGGIGFARLEVPELEEAGGHLIGYGGDAFLGLEYYFVPEFSLYMRGGFRLFSNPYRDLGKIGETGISSLETAVLLAFGGFYVF